MILRRLRAAARALRLRPGQRRRRAASRSRARPTAPTSSGTTVGSYDVLSRVVWGARTAIEVVVLAVVFSLAVGVPLGLFSGYVGGRLDKVLVLVMDALFAFPYILLAIVIAFLLSDKLGQGVVTAAIAITAVYVPQYFRVVRNHVISVREESYVEAARALGAPRRTIISRYVLQNVIQSVPALATLNAADAILTLAALGFLGYGIQPTDAAEWGYDLQRAIDDAGAGIWWTGLFPGVAIVPSSPASRCSARAQRRHQPADPRRRGRPSRRDAAGDEGEPDPAMDRPRGDGRRRERERRQPGAGGASRSSTSATFASGTAPAGDPVRAVDGVSFSIGAGETLGLVGESGCGKSTLGRGVLGLLPETAAIAGSVRYRGRELVGADREGDAGAARARARADLPGADDPARSRCRRSRRISARRSAPTARPRQGRDPRDARSRRSPAMGIPRTRFGQYPHEFSGGMRQRIMIALALVLEPKVLIADEPTTALDVIVEAQILGILADLRRNFDTAVLLITHNLGIVAEACDRVAVMYAGQIVEEGDAREVFAEPAHPYTRELLRSTISLETTGLNYIPGAPPSLIDPPPACRFHPRCPNAMRACAVQDPIEVRAPAGQRVSCWLHGPEDRDPRGRPRAARAGRVPGGRGSMSETPTAERRTGRPCSRSATSHAPTRCADSFFDRLKGRDSGIGPRRRRRHARSAPRRGARPRRRVGLRQDDARPDPARPRRGDVRARSGSRARSSPVAGRRSCGRCDGGCRSSSRTRTRRSTRR